MEILVTSDSTSLSYWLNWRVLICAIWVLTPMLIASYIIWKYQRSDHSEPEKRNQQQRAGVFYSDETWRPCLKEIHPFWLLAFRIIAFSALLGTLIDDIVVHGGGILYYYTQWTLILVTIYFGIGSLLSIYGCRQHCRMNTAFNVRSMDVEQGLFVPLTYKETAYRDRMETLNHQKNNDDFHTVGMLGHVFQVIYQISAGAVMLTDCVYWIVIFPFLTLKDYEMNYVLAVNDIFGHANDTKRRTLTVLTHTLNVIVLLGDTALNCLRFPWFRICYFILFTGVYVIFQWIIHACISLWWPYPFLDLSVQNAPAWYLLVALMHVPCYGAYALIVYLKHYLLSRWFPRSYQCFEVNRTLDPSLPGFNRLVCTRDH